MRAPGYIDPESRLVHAQQRSQFLIQCCLGPHPAAVTQRDREAPDPALLRRQFPGNPDGPNPRTLVSLAALRVAAPQLVRPCVHLRPRAKVSYRPPDGFAQSLPSGRTQYSFSFLSLIITEKPCFRSFQVLALRDPTSSQDSICSNALRSTASQPQSAIGGEIYVRSMRIDFASLIGTINSRLPEIVCVRLVEPWRTL